MTNEAQQSLLDSAKVAFKSRNYDEAEQLYNEVLHVEPVDREVLARVYCQLAHVDRARSRIVEMRAHAQQALQLAEMIDNVEVQGIALALLGEAAHVVGDHEESIGYLLGARARHEQRADANALATVNGNIGAVYLELGFYDKALEFDLLSLAGFEALHDKHGVTRTTGNLAGVHIARGNYEEALRLLASALAGYEELGELTNAAVTMNNIGLVHADLGALDVALEYSLRARAYLTDRKDLSVLASTYTNTGNIYGHLGSHDLALSDFQRAKDIFIQTSNKPGIATILGSIAAEYLSLSKFDDAMYYFQEARIAFEEIGEPLGLAITIGNIGSVYERQSDYPRALEYLEQALQSCQALGAPKQEGYWMQGIAAVEHKLGNLRAAHDRLVKLLHLRREILRSNDGVPDTLVELGAVLRDMSRPDEALERLTEALTLAHDMGLKGSSAQAHRELAELYASLGNGMSAFEEHKHYVRLKEEVQSEEALEKTRLLEYRRKSEEAERDRQIKLIRFQEQEKILFNILPSQIAERMVAGEKTIADSYESSTVFFSDIVGFTKLAQSVAAEELVALLNSIFSGYDHLARKHGLEKFKTIGDSYMAVCGVPIVVPNHAERVAMFALDVVDVMKQTLSPHGQPIPVRIGLHVGPVLAGIIGEDRIAFDLWGDAVNTASRMESHGEAGRIHVSDDFVRAVEAQTPQAKLRFISRGEMDIKGKGVMRTFFLEKM